MRADLETSSRCAMAALDVLSRAIGQLELSAEQGKRLAVLARMTREHVADILQSGELSTEPATVARDPAHVGQMSDSVPARGSLDTTASEAWAAVAKLRRATSPSDRQALFNQLHHIAAGTTNGRLRRLCLQPLA